MAIRGRPTRRRQPNEICRAESQIVKVEFRSIRFAAYRIVLRGSLGKRKCGPGFQQINPPGSRVKGIGVPGSRPDAAQARPE